MFGYRGISLMGPMCSGKTSLSKFLEKNCYDVHVVKLKKVNSLYNNENRKMINKHLNELLIINSLNTYSEVSYFEDFFHIYLDVNIQNQQNRCLNKFNIPLSIINNKNDMEWGLEKYADMIIDTNNKNIDDIGFNLLSNKHGLLAEFARDL